MSLVLEQIRMCSIDKRPLLEGASHTFYNGVTALVGKNGAGKSTLLRTLATLHPFVGGRICLGEIDLRTNTLPYLDQIMFMPQSFAACPELTGVEFLAYGLGLRGAGRRQARRIAQEWLARVGLLHAAYTKTVAYSQGMLQRLGMAYTFQVQASVYLLDEPFAGVDPESRLSLMPVLFQIAQRSAVIASTHHLDEMEQFGATFVRIQDGTLHRE